MSPLSCHEEDDLITRSRHVCLSTAVHNHQVKRTWKSVTRSTFTRKRWVVVSRTRCTSWRHPLLVPLDTPESPWSVSKEPCLWGQRGKYIRLYVVIPKSPLAGNRRGSDVRYEAPKSGRRRKRGREFSDWLRPSSSSSTLSLGSWLKQNRCADTWKIV